MNLIPPDYEMTSHGKKRVYFEHPDCPRCGNMALMSDELISMINSVREANNKPLLSIDDFYHEGHAAFICGINTVSKTENEGHLVITFHAVCPNCRTEWAPFIIDIPPVNDSDSVFRRPSPGAESLRKMVEDLNQLENEEQVVTEEKPAQKKTKAKSTDNQ